ncbi:Alpha/Beta hydrolase protein [Phlyctochytrium arcticum]|nr:Alpha/Beta hydrolase protein [Phlyctochytrium arcticum]
MIHRKHPDGWQEPDPTSSAFPHRSATHGQANAFFWFLPAQAPTTSQPPLILWLQGGPGSSSMIGLFEELGPFALDPTTHLPFRNPHTWNDRYSLLFIDNPVGSGFSFSDDSQPLYVNGYAANQRAVAQDLLKVLTKFYRLFPHQRGSPLYLAGESYAGKYIPHFAKIIQEFNQNAEHPIPFRGVMTGDGLTDPLSQITYHAPLGLAQGLISRRQARKVEELSSLAIRSARGGQWMEGARWRNKLFDYVANVTGGINFYDIRLGDAPNAHVALEHYLSRPDVRRAINVCDPSSRNNPDKNRCMPYTRDPAVKVHLLHDALRPSTPQIPPLLQSNISVLLYQGQFDFRDGAMGQSQWIEDLNWHGREEYGRAKRRIWKLGGRVVGYVTKAQGLVRVEVLGAGHFVPKDQRKVGKRMIEAFIEGGFHH